MWMMGSGLDAFFRPGVPGAFLPRGLATANLAAFGPAGFFVGLAFLASFGSLMSPSSLDLPPLFFFFLCSDMMIFGCLRSSFLTVALIGKINLQKYLQQIRVLE